MTSKRIVPLSEYHRLPQEAQTTDFYKRLLEVVCNNATLALFIMDEHQQCVYMNPAAETLTGYSLCETKGHALHNVIHHTRPDGSPYPLCECPIDQAFPQNNQEQGEEVFVHKDGHFYPVAYTASPIREGDRVIGTIIEVRDITQEKLAEQARQDALRREQELRAETEAAHRQLTHILENMSDAFVALDQDWKITYLNAEAERLNQKPRSESLGKTYWEEWSALSGTDVEHQYRRAMREKVPVHLEHHYYSPPTYDLWLEIHVSPSEEGLGIFYRDITERKQAEAALRESEQRFRRLVESNMFGVAFGDFTGGVHYANDYFLKMVGYTREEIETGQVRWLDITPTEFLPLDEKAAAELRSNGVATPFEKEYLRKDGTRIPILIGSALLQEPYEQQQEIIAFFIDLTERQQAEAALRENQALFEAFMRHSPATAYIKDEAGQYLYVNALNERICNRPLADWLGKTDFELFPLAEAQQWRNHDLAAWEAGQAIEIPETFTQADGEHYFISLKFPILQSSGRKLLGGISLDVTERERAEIALRQSEEQVRLATEAANLGMWYWDVATDTLTWTDRAKAMFGLPADIEMSMQIFLEAVHPDDRQLMQTIVSDLQAGQMHIEDEYRTLWPDGTVRWILARGNSSYNADGTLMATRGVLMDITDRKQAEAELQEGKRILDALMEYIPEGITIADAPDVTIRRVSRYGQQLTGKLRQVLENIPASEHPEHWEIFHLDGVTLATSDELPLTRATQQGEVVSNEEWILQRSDQAQIYISCNAGPIQDENGHIIGGVIAWRDISDRKQAEAEREQLLQREQALRSSAESAESKLRELLASIRENFVLFDHNWRVAYLNPQAATTMKVPREEILGRSFWDLFPNLVGTEFYDRLHHVMREKTLVQFEYYYDTWDIWFENRAYPTAEGIVVLCSNITDRKQAELEREHLLARERHYVNQLQGLTAAALAINSALSVEQVLQVITDRAASIIGVHQSVTSMTIDQNWAQAITAVYLSDKYAQWRNYDGQPGGSGIYACVCHTNRPMRMTQAELEAHQSWRGFGKEAENHPPMRGWLAAPLVGRDGKNMGLIQLSDKYDGEFTEADEAILVQLAQMASVAVEKARLYEAEQQARSAAEASREEAQAANRIKDEFLAVLSHELRSPLNPILGWSKLLQKGKLDEARTKQALTTIERNAKLQAELIEDLLDVSRILRGKLSLTVNPINLASTIKAAIETVRLAAEAKSIDLRFTILDFGVENNQQILESSATYEQSNNLKSKIVRLNAHDEVQNPKFQVAGDSTRLQQVVWNLLSNAVKFTPAGGRVEVRLSLVTDGSSRANEQGQMTFDKFAQITVSDTGKGIAPDFLPYVFDYFRQEDGATTRKFGGLGLGLAIVRHLVELHGGTIQAESQGEGMGATFTVRLPLMPTQPTVNQDPQLLEPSLDLSGVQVLVVDDDTDTREFIAFVLSQAGARVITAADALEAFTAFRQCQPDILLSDIGMPEMDGYMLMRQIRALPRSQGGQMKAIALTAYAGEFDQQQALSVGFQKHVAKPVEPEALVRAIVSVINLS
jgi:PAS domain S-box-containing protein